MNPATWTATVLTLFPSMFPGTLGHSIIGKALNSGIWNLNTIDIRDYSTDKHKSVDDTPAGGGSGMVMRADIVDAALQDVMKENFSKRSLFYLSPRGSLITQNFVQELAQNSSGIVLLCGRYEGIDQRVLDLWNIKEKSIGDFLLAGGESAALALIEACVRLLPGVLGDEDSLQEESFSNNLLEYPHYTRPTHWRGQTIPDVLLSGHHEKIRKWRLEQAEDLTRKRRPDLWKRYKQANQPKTKERN